MLRLLDRYLLGDLLRLTLLTTGVLVMVIAFGAAIKPLAKESLLTLGQTAKYVALATIPMLQFALPFAAGFAGTMSLHRMTNDNEVLAAAVAGISYRRLLAPVLGLGVALMLIMVVLTQWIIPHFWSFLDRTVAKDVTRIFQAAIERGQPFQFGDRQIYADRVIVEPHPPGTEIDTRLILLHVAAVDLDAEGRVDKDVTASRAVVDIYRRPDATYLKLTMADTVAYDPAGGVLAWAERLDSRTIVIANERSKDTRQMSRGELLRVRADPDLYGSIVSRKRHLAEALRDDVLWTLLDERLAATGEIELVADRPEGARYRVEADRLVNGRFTSAGDGAIEVRRIAAGRVDRRFRAAGAQLVHRSTAPGAPLAFDLVLDDCAVTDLSAPQRTNRKREVALENLLIPDLTAADLTGLPSAELLALAAEAGEHNALVRARADRLAKRIESLGHETTGRLQKRYALSMTALLLVALGATLALWRRESLPLTIYLWAFVPSIVDLVLISSGYQLVGDGHVAGGFMLMWSGNAVLLAMIAYAYVKLARH